MLTHATTGRSAVGAMLAAVAVATVASVLLTVVATPAAAVEAQGVRVDVAEESLFGHASFLRPGIPPGGTATYALRLRSQHEQPIEVLVYGADLVAGTGDVDSGRDNQSVGAWISTDQPRLELPPQETVEVPVSITRPPEDEDGGRGAIVVQLSDASRQELALDRIRRAALRVEVTAEGTGDGVHAEVADTALSRGLLPGVLSVDVRFAAPGPQVPGAEPGTPPEVPFDGAVVLSRPFVEDPTYPATIDVLPEGEEVTTTVEVELPWYGMVGHVRAEAAVVGLTTSSTPVRVVVVPPWLLLLLAVLAALAALRARSGTPFELPLGRVRDRLLGRDAAAGTEADAVTAGGDGEDGEDDPDDAGGSGVRAQ